MYERMLDKKQKPTFDEFIAYCGACQNLFTDVDHFLLNEIKSEKLLRFPYGNNYGWGMKYFIKSKHICDLFAEKEAFTIMLRLTDLQFQKHYDELCDYTKKIIDDRYPCGEGGWIHYRVLTEQHLIDIKNLLQLKVTNEYSA